MQACKVQPYAAPAPQVKLICPIHLNYQSQNPSLPQP